MNEERLLTPEELQSKVDELCFEIDAPDYLRRQNFMRTDSGAPHIDFIDGAYHYVVTERGSENRRDVCQSLDELLYLIFRSITFSMSSKYELKNRDESKDTRRMLFDYKLKLLRHLSDEWAQKEEKYIEGILEIAPFDDP